MGQPIPALLRFLEPLAPRRAMQRWYGGRSPYQAERPCSKTLQETGDRRPLHCASGSSARRVPVGAAHRPQKIVGLAVAARARSHDRARDRVGHRAELPQRLRAVVARAQADLRHRVEAGRAQDVDQHRGLDRVAGEERDLAQQLPARGELTGERLAEARKLGEEDPQQRLRRELGDPPGVVEHVAARGRSAGGGRSPSRTAPGLGQDRAEQPVDEVAPEVGGVGVEEQHQSPRRDRQRAPHRVALPERRAEARAAARPPGRPRPVRVARPRRCRRASRRRPRSAGRRAAPAR